VKIATVAGIILIGLGILSLAYYASPVRFMLNAAIQPHGINLVPPILGGIALVGGIALLFVIRPGKQKS
jgi:hypothetical protein